MVTEELVFEKKNGKKIRGKAYIPDRNHKNPTLIFSHGFASNYRAHEANGPFFAEAGLVTVYFDFCGGGAETISDGKLTDMTLLTEVEDLMEVIAAVEKLEYVDSENISLAGESMGGYVSSYVAAQIPDKVKTLIPWYPAYVISDDSRKRIEKGEQEVFGLMISPDFNEVAASIDVMDVIKGYRGPVKIIHGDADVIAPISYSERAVKIFENASLLVIPGAEHGFKAPENEIARKTTVDFINANK